MLQELQVGSDSQVVKNLAVVNIWCSSKELSRRLVALLEPDLNRVQLNMLDSWDPLNSQSDAAPFLLIADHIEQVRTVDDWLLHNPEQVASLMYISSENAEETVSFEFFGRFKSSIRVEREDINQCDTLARGLLYHLVDARIDSLEKKNGAADALIEHIKKQLSIFYHNINNPLTVLSGNLQLLSIIF